MGPLLTMNFNSSGSSTLRHHQVESHAGQALGVFDGDHGVLTFPNHGPLLTILDVEPLPRLIAQPLVVEQLVNPPGWSAAAGQARYLATTPLAIATVATVHHPRWVEPGGEAPRDFADIHLVAAGQLPQELWLRAVTFIEGHRFEAKTIGHRTGLAVPSRSATWAGRPRNRGYPPHGSGRDRRPSSPAGTTRRREGSENRRVRNPGGR